MGRGKEPDRYPVLRRVLDAEYGSVSGFVRASKIPKATVVLVIKGNYGKGKISDGAQKERIEAFLMADRPELDLSGLWADERSPERVTIDIKAGSRRVHIDLPANAVRFSEED